MDKALSFFRVFDLALFVPGAALYRMLPGGEPLAALTAGSESAAISTVQAIISVVGTIVLIYILGLAVHALQSLLFRWLGLRYKLRGLLQKVDRHPGDSRWSVLNDSSRSEFISYFWYMRGTCLNLSVVGVIAVLLGIGRLTGVEIMALIILAVLLLFLGCEFDYALDKSIKTCLKE